MTSKILPEQWSKLFKQYERSGLKKGDFCKKFGLSRDVFYSNMKQLRPDLIGGYRGKHQDSADLFLPIKSPQYRKMVVKTSSGIEIEFEQTPDSKWIASLLKELEVSNATY